MEAGVGKAMAFAMEGAAGALVSAAGALGRDFHSHWQPSFAARRAGVGVALQHESVGEALGIALQHALVASEVGVAQGGAPARTGNAATIRASAQTNLTIKVETRPNTLSIA